MSRIGKKPIIIPSTVKVELNGQKAKVTGPKGSLEQVFHPKVLIEQSDNQIVINMTNPEDVFEKSLWGLSRSLLFNMVEGVVNGFSKQLEINGVGFKAVVNGKKLVLNLGFSHPIEYSIPEGIEIKVEKNQVTISGIDKQRVGQIAAEIRALKKPEPYKGKGIKYSDEVIRRKAGKVVKGSA